MSKTPASKTAAIIFDFGGVFDPRHESLNGFANAAKRLNITPEQLYDRLYGGDAWRRARVGAISDHDYLTMVMHDIDPTATDVRAFRESLFTGYGIDEEVVDLARCLARRYPLALLSNATDGLEAILEAHALPAIFKVIVNSARVGIAKPDLQIYQLVLDRLGVQPASALFIDDKLRNIVAAEELGIPSILFTGAADLRRLLCERGLLDENG